MSGRQTVQRSRKHLVKGQVPPSAGHQVSLVGVKSCTHALLWQKTTLIGNKTCEGETHNDYINTSSKERGTATAAPIVIDKREEWCPDRTNGPNARDLAKGKEAVAPSMEGTLCTMRHTKCLTGDGRCVVLHLPWRGNFERRLGMRGRNS